MNYAVDNATTLVDAPWRTSTYTANTSQCVEVAPLPETIAIRDSKVPTGPALLFSTAAFARCVRAIA